ncbi:MAG: hypothetical protein HYV33_02980 [Candidatus Kerfeldbacteria bacterium]|nr:hypothetical protein [Candidatus Kerfeldbacteria bacterium]
MIRRSWREEFDSHIQDCVDELLALGYTQAAARTEAQRRFGNQANMAQQLAAIHPWLGLWADWIVFGIILFSIVPLYGINYLAAATLLGVISEQMIVWWWGGAIMTVTIVLLTWQIRLTPLTQRFSIITSFSLAFLIAISVTLILDINNFETIIYNGGWSIVAMVVLQLVWPKLGLRYKYVLVITLAAALVLFAWREQGALEQWFFPHCLYLIDTHPEAAPNASCTQVSWFTPALVLMYLLVTAALIVMVRSIVRLWNNGAYLYRKIVTTASVVLLPILPLFFFGVNSAGALDVVVWKRNIYSAYVDILGRRPEQKDYEFYAATRSYQHMSTVRAVLYDSTERRLKITLLFQNILQRNPTIEELQRYSDSVLTIKEITQDIQGLE